VFTTNKAPLLGKFIYLGPYLYIYYIFNDAVSNSDYIASNDGMVMNIVLEMMWKNSAVLHSQRTALAFTGTHDSPLGSTSDN
jgi:hypothetical protein